MRNSIFRNILSVLTLVFLSIATTGCGSSSVSTERPVIAVSIEPQKAIVDYIAGDRFDVVTMLGRSGDPETFDPAMSERRRAEEAIAYLSLNVFPFETKISQSTASSTPTYDISTGIAPLYGTHTTCAHGHSHHTGESDPHIWTSVRNMKKLAQNTTEILCLLDSVNADTYRRRLSQYYAHLDSLDYRIGQKIQPGYPFAIWHPSLSYFAHDYGLRQMAVGSENKEMPTSALKATIDSARNARVNILFIQKEYDTRQAQSVCDAIGARMVEIQPMAYNWEEELLKIADELARP